MDKPFVYGVAVSGDNFTDRKKETKRLKMNFESGVNSILISPRRMGKTSIVGKVMSSMTDPKIKVVMMTYTIAEVNLIFTNGSRLP